MGAYWRAVWRVGAEILVPLVFAPCSQWPITDSKPDHPRLQTILSEGPNHAIRASKPGIRASKPAYPSLQTRLSEAPNQLSEAPNQTRARLDRGAPADRNRNQCDLPEITLMGQFLARESTGWFGASDRPTRARGWPET